MAPSRDVPFSPIFTNQPGLSRLSILTPSPCSQSPSHWRGVPFLESKEEGHSVQLTPCRQAVGGRLRPTIRFNGLFDGALLVMPLT